MAAQVEIILRTIDQTGPGMKKAAGSFTELNSAIQLARQGIEAMKKAYEFGREGAQIDFIKGKFDRLSQSIGTTSDALLRDLKTATRGLYSDMELMASAGDLVALGLAKTHDEAVRLASVSAGLNMNMNQLVLTLTNMTTMRFDALGVSVDGFKDKVKELEKSGLSAEAAFKEAFLQQAEDQLIKVGHAADSNLGSFMKLEAEVKNLSDTLKVMLAPAMLEVVGHLSNSVQGTNQLISALQETKLAWKEAASNTDRATMAMKAWIGMQEGMRAAMLPGFIRDIGAAADESQGSIAEFSFQIKDAAEGLGQLGGGIRLTTEQLTAMDERSTLFIDTLSTVGDAMTDYRDGLADAKDQLEAGEINLEQYSEKVRGLGDAYEETKNKIILSIVEMKLAQDGWTDAELNAYLQIGQQLGQFDAQMVATTKGYIRMADGLVDGTIDITSNIDRMGKRAIDAAEAFQNSLSPAAERLGDTIGNSALPMASALRLQLSGMPADGRAWNYYFNIHQSGSVPRVPSAGQHDQVGSLAGTPLGGGMYTGGWLTDGIHVVGDLPGGGFGPQTEAIINGYVYNARQTRMLKELGWLDGAMSHALDPGEGGGGGGTSGGRPGSGGSSGGGTSGGGTRPGRPGRPNRNPGGGGSAPASSFTPAVMAAEAAVEVAASSLMAAESIAANVQQGAQQTVSATYDSSGQVVNAVDNVAHKIDKLIRITREASYREQLSV